MKVSLDWIQEYVKEKLPTPEAIVSALTMHSFEIEGTEKAGTDTVIDVKILPDRAHYCLCHYGVAEEIALVSKLTLKSRPDLPVYPVPKELEVVIEDEKRCRRYCGAILKGVKVGLSPDWLKKRLEAVGQRSINNIVDATNYVMFSIGQPLHAFDLSKLKTENGKVKIEVKKIVAEEKITALDGKEYSLSKDTLVIADGNLETGYSTLAIAGVKGGAAAAISESTIDLVLESANFDPVTVRKTGRGLGLLTDASKRFENEITPELALRGLSELIELIQKIAGGKLEGVVDVYPKPVQPYKVGISLWELNSILGATLTEAEVEEIMNRLAWKHGNVDPQEYIIRKIRELLGMPYKWGASVLYDAPRSFDCSSISSYLYKEAGVQIPRIVVDQYVFGQKISKEDLHPGDVVFSKTNRQTRKPDEASIEYLTGTPVPGGVSHLGIYIGDGKIIHAADPEGVIEEDLATSTRFKEIVGYGRMCVLNERRWWVEVPAERLDIRLKEDLAEEIARVYGYDHIESKMPKVVEVSERKIYKMQYYRNKVSEILVEEGFSEIYTYAFASSGNVEVANPIASDKGFLRSNLFANLSASLELNLKNAELLGLDQIKIFEIGKIFSTEKEGGEHISFCVGIANTKGFRKAALPKDEQSVNGEIRAVREMLLEKLGADIQTLCTIDDSGGLLIANNKQIGVINNQDGIMEINFDAFVEALPEPKEVLDDTSDVKSTTETTVKYQPISAYPFIVRDIAVFVPGEGGSEEEVLSIIKAEGTDLLKRTRLFDTFTKKGHDASSGSLAAESTKTSYGYRLVFQSDSRTLTDEEANTIMQKISEKMNANTGWQVR